MKALGIVTAVVVAVAVCGYVVYQHMLPGLRGSHCQAKGPGGVSVRLDLDQAANAATIAGVAFRKHLPERAVAIAYATALQESKLRNLSYGDRDSVGLFQQRPSQGWGTRAQLSDPIYATQRFYQVLVKVPDYLHMPIATAAQHVQHSADGSAYAVHEGDAKILAATFTGRRPHALHCWYPSIDRQRRSTADRLQRTFGGLHISGPAVTPENRRQGWAVASWAVANAHAYGLHSVAYAGSIWRAEHGFDGWQPADDPGDRSVVTIR